MNRHRRSRGIHLISSPLACVESLENRSLLSAVAGVISGRVVDDLSASGKVKHNAPGLANWQVFIDANDNGVLDSGEQVTTTDANGNWQFSGLSRGTYIVREVLQTGWRETNPAGGAITVHLGNKVTNRIFANTDEAVITGTVFRDDNGNGTQDGHEPGLTGMKVFVDANNNGVLDAGETVVRSQAHGIYRLVLNAGTYTIRQVANSHYALTAPAAGDYVLTVASGQVVTGQNFGDQPIKKHKTGGGNTGGNGGGNTGGNGGGTGGTTSGTGTTNGFVITWTRAADANLSGDDIVTFRAKNSGTGPLAGTMDVLAEDATLSSSSGLVIRTYGNGNADFTGTHTGNSGSYISFGGSQFFAASQVPSPTTGTYTDLQTVPQFEVAGAILGGVPANTGNGIVIAVAVVHHGAAVSVSGQLGAEQGSSLNFSASA